MDELKGILFILGAIVVGLIVLGTGYHQGFKAGQQDAERANTRKDFRR